MRLFLTASTLCLCATTLAACPWAGGTYDGEFAPDYALRLTVNANCTSVRLTETYGNVTATVAMAPKGKGWRAKHSDGTVLDFDARGKKVRGSRGGASRSARMQRVN